MAGKKRKQGTAREPRFTAQQRLFVAFYLQRQNGAWAARQAGYEEDRARFTARDLLTKRHIRDAIAAGFARLLHEHSITAGRILREYERLAFSDMGSLVAWGEDGVATWSSSDEVGPDVTAALSEFTHRVTYSPQREGPPEVTHEIKAKFHKKQPALDKLHEYVTLAAAQDDGEQEAGGGMTIVPADSTIWREEAERGRA